MANITFLIGNGFDCACGLKSRYLDTYDGYIKSESATKRIADFKKIIEKNIATWADFEMKLAEYAHTFNNESELIECICDYKEYLNTYLLQEQQRFLGFGKGIGSVESAVRLEMAKSLFYFFEGLIPNDKQAVLSALNDARAIYYQFISFNYTTVFDELISDVFSHDELASLSKKSISHYPVIHIHGRLNNDVVLGVDNESQLSEVQYSLSSRGKRNILKPDFIDQYDTQRKKNALMCIQSSTVICAYGVSLGESDLSWRKALAEWLFDRSHHLVYYRHSLSSKRYPATAITQKMDDEEDYKEVLIKTLFGEEISDDLHEQLAKQIHIPVGTNIFNISTAKQEANERYISSLLRTKNRPKENVTA